MSEQSPVQEQSFAKTRKMPGVLHAAGRAALGLSLAVAVGAGLAYKDEIEQRITPTIEFSLTDPLVESLVGSEPVESVDHSVNIDTTFMSTEFSAVGEESQNPLPDNAFIQSLIG